MLLPSQSLEKFWDEYERCYNSIMKLKLGLLVLDERGDERLVQDLLSVGLPPAPCTASSCLPALTSHGEM